MKQKLLCFFVLGFMLIGSAYAQDKRINGRVTAADNGEVLAGVSVSAVGSNVSTQTNDLGEFVITVSSGTNSLRFTSVGFETQTANIPGNNVVNVQLLRSAQEIAEVLIQVPYGTVRKTAFVGSETTVGSKTFEQQRPASFTRALEGMVPGLVSTNGGGGPGTNASVLVRGIGSVSAGSGPLYVLDGVPYSGSNVSLSTDDIETVTVLKDASSTALYGARGANGVIMITTKRGQAGNPRINANVRTGFQNRGIPEYDRVNQQQYYELMWEATRNSLVGGDYSQITPEINQQASERLIPGLIYNSTNVANNQVVLPTGQFNPAASFLWDDNWEDALTQTPFRQDYNVNATGGSDKGNYLMSVGYLNEPGVAKFSGYDRYTGRVRAEVKPKDWLTSGLSVDGALGYYQDVLTGGTSTTNPFYFSRQMGPIYPIWERDAAGTILIDPVTGNRVLDWGVPDQYGTRPYAGNSNLLGSLDLDDRSSMVGNVNANTFLDIKFLEDFTFRTTVGGTYYNSFGTTYQNSQFGDAQNVSGRSTKSNNRQLSFTFNQVLSYNKMWGEHSLDVLVGHENYRFQQNYVSATKTDFPFPGTTELNPAATISGVSSYEHNHRIEGYFSNLQYQFRDRYLLSASIRTDGNSRFYPGGEEFPNAQWGQFWSLGAGWRMTEEAFMSDVSWLNELKWKVSYGELGNESLSSYYAWQSLYSLGWNNENNPGAVISSLPNEELSWEKNANLNIGADFAMFNQRLNGTIEWYKKTTKDMLFSVPLPVSTGISSISRNIGNMENSGFDVSLGYNAVRTTDIDWRLDVNFTHFKNKITKLPEENPDGIVSGSHKLEEGKDRYRFWLREYAGVDSETGDALFYRDVLDADGEPTGERTTTNNITNATYYHHGSAIPDFTMGIGSSFRYKNLELYFLLNWNQGGLFYDGNYASLMHVGSYGTHWHTDILNRWQQPGDITDVPRIQNALANQSGASTRYLYDATNVNIKNISLTYTLPATWLHGVDMRSVKLFGSVDNAHLFSTRKGMDPQRSFGGTSDWSYVPVRTFTFGVSVGL